MALATASKIFRKFSGRFNEKGEFIPKQGSTPRRHHCGCNPNGFVVGQVINHYKFCPYHKKNIDAFLAQEGTAVLVIVALLVFALCSVSAYGVIASILTLV